MKITIADLKKQLKLQRETLRYASDVESAQKTLSTIEMLSNTINKTFEEITVSLEEGGEVISMKAFLTNLKSKQREKQVLESFVFEGAEEEKRRTTCLELAKLIEEQKVAYAKFLYSTEFELAET